MGKKVSKKKRESNPLCNASTDLSENEANFVEIMQKVEQYEDYFSNNTFKLDQCLEVYESKKISESDFQQLKMLGKGTFGTVVLVKHKKDNDKLYALKIISKKQIKEALQVEHTLSERR